MVLVVIWLLAGSVRHRVRRALVQVATRGHEGCALDAELLGLVIRTMWSFSERVRVSVCYCI